MNKMNLKTAKAVIKAIDMERRMCEDATGCREHVKEGGQFYDNSGEKISDTKARRLFREGGSIEAPNAGSGSYRAVLARLGFSSVKVEDWTSSAGDWVLAVRGGLVFQSNRYPRHGFLYSLDKSQRSERLSA